MPRYIARGKTLGGEIASAEVNAEDYDDAIWQFSLGLYQTPEGTPMSIMIDYRTVKRANRGADHDR